ISFLSTFASPNAPETRSSQYFEMLGNRAMYADGWMTASRTGLLPWIYTNQPPPDPNKLPWELYDLRKDYSEAENVAAQHPEKVKELADRFNEEASRNNVFPLDPWFGGRQARPTENPFRYYTTPGNLSVSLTPAYENHSHRITAYVNIPAG